MLDLSRIVGFEWDEGNSRKSEDRHGVSQAEAEEIFFDPLVVVSDDTKHSGDEDRFHAIGMTIDRRGLHVTFTTRQGGKVIRVISARPMNRKERRRYEEEKA